MTGTISSPTTSRRRHIVRLGAFATALLTLFCVVGFAGVIDVDVVRTAVAATGPVAPLTYIAVSAVLAAVSFQVPCSQPGAACCSVPCSGLP